MSVKPAKVVIGLPLKSIVNVSPTTLVTISLPPVTVNVSEELSAVVDPVSPATVANRLTFDKPASSAAGTHLLLVSFHLSTWFAVGAAVVVSTSDKPSILVYSVRSFALVSPTPPVVILMFTYGLSSPSTVKKYPVKSAATGAAANELYSPLCLRRAGMSIAPFAPRNVDVIPPTVSRRLPVPFGAITTLPLLDEIIELLFTSRDDVRAL